MADPTKKKKEPMDLVSRGQYGPSPLGSTIFVGLRALDGLVLQRALQILNPIPALFKRFNLSIPPAPPTGEGSLITTTTGTGTVIDITGHALTPFQAVLWGMSIASAVKHDYWLLGISNEIMTPQGAVFIGLFNTVCNSVNTMLFSLAGMNPTWSQTGMYASIPLFVAGMLIETVSEVQRKKFKSDPRNKGKPFSGGLFGYARSINYFGYTVWRGAFALAAGGWVWGGVVAGWFWWDFTTRAIPVMDEYCSERYGAQWIEVKKKVPYAFFPGVY